MVIRSLSVQDHGTGRDGGRSVSRGAEIVGMVRTAARWSGVSREGMRSFRKGQPLGQPQQVILPRGVAQGRPRTRPKAGVSGRLSIAFLSDPDSDIMLPQRHAEAGGWRHGGVVNDAIREGLTSLELGRSLGGGHDNDVTH
jgi:hypothetical protein